MNTDAKKRFSDRVENYIRYRPGYPPEVFGLLQRACGLTAAWRVADIGAGTGLLAEGFLQMGCQVYGVEPNREMRLAGESLLRKYPAYHSVEGSAEETNLETESVDLVSAGQAFHWFDPAGAGRELRRILKPDGWAVLIWNERRLDSTPFLRGYESLLQRYATDYNQVNHRNVEDDPATILNFFGGSFSEARYDNRQIFNYSGVEGRLLSSSYAPLPGQANYTAMIVELKKIFDACQKNGEIAFEYDTHVFYGQLNRRSS